MYGDDKLNNHGILRYGLTLDYCETFSSLKYLDIELPLTLVRNFHIFIKTFVDNNLFNYNYINRLQEKYNINTVGDVQKALNHKQRQIKDLSKAPNRKTVLMPAALVTLALDQFSDAPILLMVHNHYDKTALKGQKLPGNLVKYSFARDLVRVKIPRTDIVNLQTQLKQIFLSVKTHDVFDTLEFKQWFEVLLTRMVKNVYFLDRLIRRSNIGVILDHFEITVPGNILSLLALKYNLPFIYAPQLLITDQSFIPTKASLYCAWGENYKQWMIKRGIEPTKIKITGNLRFEYAKNKIAISKKEFINLMNIPSDHFIITFTTQQFEEKVNMEIMDWIEKFYYSIQNIPITFVIRPHPSDHTDYTPFLNISKIKLAPGQLDLFDTLKNSDFVMTVSSGTAIEAAILRKGIIVLQPSIPYHYDYNNDFHSHLVKAKAGLNVYKDKDLAKYLTKIVTYEDFRNSAINQGQQFLNNTLELNYSPPVIIRQLIKNYLNKKDGSSD